MPSVGLHMNNIVQIPKRAEMEKIPPPQRLLMCPKEVKTKVKNRIKQKRRYDNIIMNLYKPFKIPSFDGTTDYY